MKRPTAAMILTLFLIGATTLMACGFSVESRTNDFSVGRSPAVQIEVGNGSITLVVGQEGMIAVTAELRKPEDIQYEVSQVGDLVIIEVETGSDSKADVTVTVPVDTEFEVSCGNGRIDVTGMRAPGVVNLGNGDSTLIDVVGSIIVNNGNGDIRLDEARGSFVLNDGNGAIKFQGELDPGTLSAMNVGNGSVKVELSGSPSIALNLEIEDRGAISVDLPVSATEQSDHRFVGTIGSGEASLNVSAGRGDITIK